MSSKKPSPRCHVIIARDEPVAIIIRRGPSDYVCTIGWDTRTDTFTMGQWLKARIYENRCDLSPDGKFFLYFVFDGRQYGSNMRSYSAVSRRPYLKAVSLWPKGDTYGGGGLFEQNRKLWLHDAHDDPLPLAQEKLDWRLQHYNIRSTYYMPGPFFERMVRDGWIFGKRCDGYGFSDKEILAPWILRRSEIYDDSRYFLVNNSNGETRVFPDWDWADWDEERKQVMWIAEGILYRGSLENGKLLNFTSLLDMNHMRFQRIKAPY